MIFKIKKPPIDEKNSFDRKLDRKKEILGHYNKLASKPSSWINKNDFFHSQDRSYFRFLISENLRILDIGCGNGDLLASLKPSDGIGLDISTKMIDLAKSKYSSKENPNLRFLAGDIEDEKIISELKGTFDIILLSDTVGLIDDVQNCFSSLHNLCHSDTRVIVSYFSWLWTPILVSSEALSLKRKQMPLNHLSAKDIDDLLEISDFDIIKRDWRQLIPKHLFGIGPAVNRTIATLPLIRKLCVRNYVVARSLKAIRNIRPSTTIVIPCRNERGNILPAVQRLPEFNSDMEILFVEGHSSDGTLEEINRVIKEFPHKNIRVTVQDGMGKGDAVRKAFKMASNDILMILDADLTVPPEDLIKFYNAISSGKGEFINGTRFIYPMEKGAMRWLNVGGNLFFAWVFSWLLNQRFTDTLCGTKVLSKEHYKSIAKNRSYFGDFDPFGDFDLIFGATKLNLKVVEIPIRYAERTYGTTQISRFRHGLMLLRMVFFAFRKLKSL
mgnify:FL=1|tara:strand:+ start:49095 stop:50588 length:1494 start_codon:yes stop_codon:yes gene_type:complete